MTQNNYLKLQITYLKDLTMTGKNQNTKNKNFQMYIPKKRKCMKIYNKNQLG